MDLQRRLEPYELLQLVRREINRYLKEFPVSGGGGGGSGDMLKSVYDTNNNGVVDTCTAFTYSNLSGIPSTFTPAAHSHTIPDITALQATLDAKAALASPALTGTPTAPTASLGANTTQVATTAFVIGQAASVAPLNLGTASIGTSTQFARQDHVHNRQTAIVTGEISSAQVTNTLLANMGTNTIKGRITAGSGVPEDLTAANVRTIINVADGANNYVHPNHSGDVTSTGDGVTVIGANKVTLPMLAQVSTARLRGRVTAGTGNVEDLTGTQATTLLDVFGTSLKGLAPASGGGTTNFLRADGAWAVPAGGGGGGGIVYPSWVSGTDIDAAVTALAPTTSALATGTLRGYLWFVPAAVTVTALRVNVTTAVAATTMRVGVYTFGSTWYPSTLVTGSAVGTIDTGTTGVKTSTFGSPIALSSGWYVIAYASSGAPTTRALAAGAMQPLGVGADPTMPATRANIWTATFTYAALPTTFTAGGTRVNVTGAPQVIFRVQ